MKKASFLWSLDRQGLAAYTSRQLNHLFFDGVSVEPSALDPYLDETMKRIEVCFHEIRKKYYVDNNVTQFDHLHSDHYATFLYLLSNVVFRAKGPLQLATKIFLLNKALHGLDAFYAISLPEVFLFVHPVGTILGNARYSNYLAIYQNCSIGSDEDGHYPVFGEGTLLYSKTSVIGSCHLGSNVVLGANAFLMNTDIPDNTLVVGSYPHLRLLANKSSVIDRIFR